MSTFEDFKNFETSEKNVLIQLEFAKRLMGWVVHSGSVYKITSFNESTIVSIEDSGTALTEVADIASVSAGNFYNDRTNQVLYLETSDSADPNGKFIAMIAKMFFSQSGINASNDLNTGPEVEWLPLIDRVDGVKTGLDNQNQFGNAIESNGSITFMNDQSYWKTRYDKLIFENQRCFIYMWNRTLPITDAKLIYKGRVESKSWSQRSVSFRLKDLIGELRRPIPLSTMENVSGVRIPDDLKQALQRRIYGQVNGLRPMNIDQVLEGYPLTGTVSVATNVITGTGTSFLTELSPGDKVKIADTGNDEFAVESVDSDTQVTLSETPANSFSSGSTLYVVPDLPKPYINREWFVAGHALRNPTTTVTTSISSRAFIVANAADIRSGDEVLVGSSELAFVTQASSSGFIKLDRNLVLPPSTGTTVERLSILNVRLNNDRLQYIRDYTYNAATGRLTIDTDAEVNVAPVRTLNGTSVSFTNTSRNVTGSGTVFTAQLKPGDYLRPRGQSTFFEILEVTDDTNLILRTASTYTTTAVGEFKAPKYFDPDNDDVLSVSVIGKTDDGLKTGEFLEKGAEIVEDLLIEAGLSGDLDTASFTKSKAIAPQRLGIAIPETFNGTDAPSIKDIISDVNRSIFGSLIQDNDLNLEYNILEPIRETSTRRLFEHDVLSFLVRSESKNIIKTAKVRYNFREYDYLSRDKAFDVQSKTSDIAQYLAKTNNEKIINTILVDSNDARIFANRWAFILEVASSVITVNTKLQLIDNQVNDRIDITHQKFYERIGSSGTRKIAGIQSITKSQNGVTIELEDLANAFSRCGVITLNDADTFAESNQDGIFWNGFITDNNGMQSNDPETFGVNLIF